MKLANYFFVVLCLSAPSLTYSFSYDSAIYAAQKGDIQSADEQLRSIVVNHPDDADLLYDAGVIAHKSNNFSQAAGYFSRATQYAVDDDALRFQAYYNAGNAYVENKDLKTALASYDKALAIEPDNEYARNNRDRVAQMLQEQEKQQDQQKNDDQKDDEKDEKNEKDEKEDKDKQKDDQQDKGDQSGDQNEQQQKQGNDQQQGGDDQSDQKSKGNEGDDSKDGEKGEERKNHGNKAQDKQKPTNDKQGNGEQDLDKKAEREQNERKQQQAKQHEKTPDKQGDAKDKNNVTSADKQSSFAKASSSAEATADATADTDTSAGTPIDDPWLLGILNDQELRDKAINKQLMEAKVRQHGGKNGQNNW